MNKTNLMVLSLVPLSESSKTKKIKSKGNNQMPKKTRTEIINDTTIAYLANIDKTNPPNPRLLKNELIYAVEQAIHAENQKNKTRLHYPTQLTNMQIALILNHLYDTCVFPNPNPKRKTPVIGIYQPQSGLYTLRTSVLWHYMKQYNFNINLKDERNVTKLLYQLCNNTATYQPNLIPLSDGILNYENNTLLPFDPQYTFTNKSELTYQEWQQTIRPMTQTEIYDFIDTVETLDEIRIIFKQNDTSNDPVYIEGKIINITSCKNLRVRPKYNSHSLVTIENSSIIYIAIISKLEDRLKSQ